MEDVWWGNRDAGSPLSRGSHRHGTAGEIVLTAVPDWVRLPPELGGATVKVLDVFTASCPQGDACDDCRHYRLEDGIYVAECLTHKFVWYTRRSTNEER